MGKKRNFTIALGIIFLIAIIIVWFNPFKFLIEDNFYLVHGGLNFKRFPLIKPYEAIYMSKEYGWEINLHGYSHGETYIDLITIMRVEGLSVQNEVLTIYSSKPDDYNVYNTPPQLYKWFVIIPKDKIEVGFSDEIDFYNYLKNYEITEVKWQTPDQISGRYDWTWCLEWIPVCK
jgi:hypothetical protein